MHIHVFRFRSRTMNPVQLLDAWRMNGGGKAEARFPEAKPRNDHNQAIPVPVKKSKKEMTA